MHPILLCMALGTLFGAGLAIATEQTPSQRSPSYLSKYQDQFRAADADGDGRLSKPEAAQARMHRIVESFDQLDANRDGLLTPAEIRLLLRSRISS